MAICHFDSHGKRHQYSKLFFFLNFHDSSKLAFIQHTYTCVLFHVHGFLGSARINLKKSHERLPRGSRQASDSCRRVHQAAAATKTGLESQDTQRGNGLQPMNTKHGEATGKLTNRLKRAYFSHYQNQHRCQTSQHPNPDVIC